MVASPCGLLSGQYNVLWQASETWPRSGLNEHTKGHGTEDRNRDTQTGFTQLGVRDFGVFHALLERPRKTGVTHDDGYRILSNVLQINSFSRG